jgi:hypothetical protein
MHNGTTVKINNCSSKWCTSHKWGIPWMTVMLKCLTWIPVCRYC